jgi:hypothetical protein
MSRRGLVITVRVRHDQRARDMSSCLLFLSQQNARFLHFLQKYFTEVDFTLN